MAVPLHESRLAAHRSLICSVCGYGIARQIPPGPCPMCRADDAWEPERRPGEDGSAPSGG